MAYLVVSSAGTLPTNAGNSATKEGVNLAEFKPVPLSEGGLKAIEYLVNQQNSDGSWSQGEESKYMASVGQKNGDIHDVADTCMAALALIRAGSLPNSGKYATQLTRATSYVCGSIEKSDQDSLFITDVRGTRVQTKLGQYVDTFLASVFLPEVKGHMKTGDENERVLTALNKVVHKIEKNQAADGSFANGGWAPIHSQSFALQGLNKAMQAGVAVDQKALNRAESFSRNGFDAKKPNFGGVGNAGVPLYSAGAYLGGMKTSMDSFNLIKDKLSSVATSPSSSPAQAQEARTRLKNYEDESKERNIAVKAVTDRINDGSFVQGFGCNGGEEFLSYYQISQTLVTDKSKEWPEWRNKMAANLGRVQNPDGSWMGQHCITSRTFCTAAALLVLTADRSPQPKAIASSK
ncbi:unnamed protein product [Sphagnum jensenii]